MLLRNRFTGQKKWLPSMSADGRSMWLLQKAIRAFDRCVDVNQLTVSFLTITQSDTSVDTGYRWISGVMNNMAHVFRRAGLLFFYVAVLEIQPKRYRKYGILAAHWHVAVAVSIPRSLPHGKRLENGHVEKVRDGSVITWDWLYKNVKQKFGIYFVCDCWSKNVYDYLGKYIGKGELLKELRERMKKLKRKVRVFSSSRLPLRYRMSWAQIVDYQGLVDELPELADLYWRKEGARVVARAKTVNEKYFLDGRSYSRVEYDRVLTIKGEWILDDGGVDDERSLLGGSVVVKNFET